MYCICFRWSVRQDLYEAVEILKRTPLTISASTSQTSSRLCDTYDILMSYHMRRPRAPSPSKCYRNESVVEMVEKVITGLPCAKKSHAEVSMTIILSHWLNGYSRTCLLLDSFHAHPFSRLQRRKGVLCASAPRRSHPSAIMQLGIDLPVICVTQCDWPFAGCN